VSSDTQAERLLEIDTPLGKDVLLLQDLSGAERISRPFQFRLNLLSTNGSLEYKTIVGQRVSITLKMGDNKKRYLNGFVSSFSQGKTDERFTAYTAEVVPWLWFLSRTSDCRIFQNKSVPDIVKQVFSDLGFQDFKLSLQGQYEPLVYCVQYRESDLNFVSRLMEHAGILYFFEHDKDKHTLVLGDATSVHKPCPEQSNARMDYTAGGAIWDEDVVSAWRMDLNLRPGKYALTDYNFETPGTNLLSSEETVYKVGGNDAYEIYDYPGDYGKKNEGEAATKLRMQEEETAHLWAAGSGGCRSFVTGYKFDLSGHSRSELNRSYLLTEVRHSASVGANYYSSGNSSDAFYSNDFSCIPASIPFRPPRLTPKPFVQGPQTAVVVGPAGEEIYTDKYSRIKVQFFWDRQGKKDENSSCWMRVSQPWAGKGWGAINIPRIGQEVIVEFLEGDPDRPIITGRFYNAEQMPPYKLADNQTRTTFMSRSTKGGGASNFNELRFEDQKGSEQIFMNAEQDMDLRVENQSREFIGSDRHLIVKANQRELVEADKHAHVKGTHFEKIDGDMSLQIGAKQMEKVGGDKSIEVDGARKEEIVGNDSLQVGRDQKTQIGGNLSLQVGQSSNAKVGMTHAMEAGQTIHLKGGMTVIIEAGMQLSLVGPGGFIDIGPAGVSIQGTMVLINSGGAAGSGPGANTSAPDNPDAPKDPKDPDTADDGTKGGKLNN
jgi:type VI secretion system secreted protein VgrG